MAAERYWVVPAMVPAQEIAAHTWSCAAAAVTRMRTFSVIGSEIELAPGPHVFRRRAK